MRAPIVTDAQIVQDLPRCLLSVAPVVTGPVPFRDQRGPVPYGTSVTRRSFKTLPPRLPILHPMTPEEFRRVGYRLIDWIADYRGTVEQQPVMSNQRPGEVRAKLPARAPDDPEGLEDIAKDLTELVVPGITHWNHPNFFAYFPSNSSLASVLAELVTAGIGAQAMSWQTSPAATEFEETMMEWMRQLAGLPPSFQGVIQDAASTASLVGLICARERTTDYGQERTGLVQYPRRLIVYTSEEAHSSVVKAGLLAGFGRDDVRLIETDEVYALRPDALRAAIEDDLAHDRQPCAVVATIGTTATTAVDPVPAIADLCDAHDMWLHVDAALAGTALLLPEKRALFQGVERAHSFVWNAHKWLGTTFDLSLYYTQAPKHLVRVMSTNPSYLQTGVDAEVRNYRDWGIPLGRRFRALKLWFLLRDQGVSGLQARLRRDINNADWLAQQIDAAPSWKRLVPVTFQTVCFRHEPPGMSASEADAHNLALVNEVNRSGQAYLTSTVVRGRRIIRVSVGALNTERHHVASVWAQLQALAGEQGIETQ